MHKLISILFIAFIAITVSSCSKTHFASEDPGWVLLGEKKVNHLRESDVIAIKSRDKYISLQLYVPAGSVEIKDIEIMLINGDILKPALDEKIGQGGRSRIIELAEDGRQLDNIRIRYSSGGKLFSKKAVIQVGGRLHNASRN